MATKQAASKKPSSVTKKAKHQRIRIRLQAFDHRLLDTSAERLVEVATQSGCKVVGPIPLPTHRKIFCVNRAPHADKKSREHFGILIHKRIIDIQDPSHEVMAQLSRVDMPAGVGIEVKL